MPHLPIDPISRPIAVGLVIFLAGCGGSAVPPSGGQQTLIYARAADADFLDPIHTDMGESVKVLVNVFETLVTYHEETPELVPCLAVKWETSQDGKQWTFHLREGVKFHDGTDLNAQAVVFSFRRLMGQPTEEAGSTEAKATLPANGKDPSDPAAGGKDAAAVEAEQRPYATSYTMIQKVEAVDGLTVRFHLNAPSAVFLENLAMFAASIVSPKAARELGPQFSNHPVGTGPFRFVSWVRKQTIELAAFDRYWGKKAASAGVVFIPTPENAVRAEQVRRGEAHFADELPPSEIDALEKSPGVIIQRQRGVNVGYLAMQTEKKPLADVRVRRAIAMAIDKNRLIAGPYSGHGEPAVNMVPKSMWGHHDGLVDRKFDPAEARRLCEEGVQAQGLSLPVSLKLFVMAAARPYMPQPRETALFIRDALAPLGLACEIVTNDNNQHFQRMMRGEHDLGLAGWSSDNNDPDNFLYSLLDPDNILDQGGNNLARYRRKEFHDLLLRGREELDREKRKEIYRQAQEMVFDDAPVVPLVHTDVRIAQRSQVTGYRLHPTSLVRLVRASLQGGAP